MTTRAVEQVDEWESRPFSGGYRGLHDLADERFSGIVTVGPTRLCMTKGSVVGILDGSIDAFEDASGTAHESPSPALPLLAVMQDRADEVQGKYYTEDTPIEEVDSTLSDGNFTGFIELSENVLSGDYYVVYHQGRSMSVAFVGASGQLLTDDEAFEQANDEVGIYEARPVDIEVIEIPEPEDGAAGGAAAGGTDPEPATAEAEADAGAETTATDPEPTTDTASPGESTSEARSESQPSPDRSDSGRQESSARSSGGQQSSARSSGGQQSGGRSSGGQQSGGRSGGGQQRSTETRESGARQQGTGGSRQPDRSQSPDPPSPEPVSTETVAGLETRSIPSLDPDRTNEPEEQSNDSPAPGPESRQPQEPGRQRPQSPRGNQPRQQPQRGEQSEARQRQSQPEGGGGRGEAGPQSGGRPQNGNPQPEPSADPAEIEELESELEAREEEIRRLESELESVEDERDDLREERDELRERVEELERRINELRTEEGHESVADRRRLSPDETIDGTNLFIRYQSKGQATLEKAYRGNAEATAVNDNLEIQHHTQFEAEDVAVNGEPYEDFLEGTLQYAFVTWVVRVLPYEIRDTNHESALQDLYDALPKIDRAELNGAITVTYEENGEEQRSQETFDIILRDRMGNPLAVANMNQSRQPASENMMESLITSASRVGEVKGSLSGVFLVTSSFFEPGAMEAAEDATGSGLLSRDKRQSFVKLSRKDGFHLCLVEAREDQFNLSVPEL